MKSEPLSKHSIQKITTQRARRSLACAAVCLSLLVSCDKPNTDIEVDVETTSNNEGLSAGALERSPESSAAKTQSPALPKGAYKTIEWTDLIPPEDLDALKNPPEYLNEISDGSIDDQISSNLSNQPKALDEQSSEKEKRYQQALTSTRVVAEMHEQAIRVPGFIVPLEFDDEQTITQFFLVPFFGACIHTPPPPPNQIIFVEAAEGIQLDALYDPFWVSGVLSTTLLENELATSAYSMQMQFIEVYSD